MLMNVRTSAVMVPVALASVLALAPVSGAFAQSQSPQSQGQAQGQSAQPTQPPGQPAGTRQNQNQGQEQSAHGAGVDVPFTSTSGEQGEQVVNGVFTIQRFVQEGAQVVAVGKVTATTSSSEGNVQNFVTQARLPLLPSTTPGDVCSTLQVELGPLDVDLRGQRLQLDQIAVDITAQSVDVTTTPGTDNQLATQLCSIGGLLDRGELSSGGAQLAEQLNRLLELLG